MKSGSLFAIAITRGWRAALRGFEIRQFDKPPFPSTCNI